MDQPGLGNRDSRDLQELLDGQTPGADPTGRERRVELSSHLSSVLLERRPDIYADNSLLFPNDDDGGFIDQCNFRSRISSKIARKALERDRRFTPHGLRHTFASLHLSRGTNLLWVQQQGGWLSPAVLLSTYTHFLPTEIGGYADALAAPDSEGARSRATRKRESLSNDDLFAGGPPRTRTEDRWIKSPLLYQLS